MHALPALADTPQEPVDSAAVGIHVVPEQHPSQLAGPQPLTHAPPWHVSDPPVHAAQLTPSRPQAVVCWLASTQTLPWQQPPAQVEALHGT